MAIMLVGLTLILTGGVLESAAPTAHAQSAEPSASGGSLADVRGSADDPKGTSPGEAGPFAASPGKTIRSASVGSHAITSWGVDPSVQAGVPADAQVAASRTHIVVTARRPIAFYNKAGQLLTPAIQPPDFFAGLGLGGPTGCSAASPNDAAKCGDSDIVEYNDTRVLFDEYRKRFWVTAIGYNKYKADCCRDSLKQETKIRDILALAVSKSENPLDGWYLYYTDANLKVGDDADYPSFGVSPGAVSVVNIAGKTRYANLVAFPAAALAKGTVADGWRYTDLKDPDGQGTQFLQAVVHHGTEDDRSFYVSQWGSKRVLVWAVSHPFGSDRKIERASIELSTSLSGPPPVPQKGSPVPLGDGVGNLPVKAVYRGGTIYVAMSDAKTGPSGPVATVRIVSIIPQPVIRYAIREGEFVIAGATDASGTPTHLRWPAVEVNKNKEKVAVFGASGCSRYAGVAYSVSGSVAGGAQVLKTGEAAYGFPGTCTESPSIAQAFWGDTAGASVDPFDDTAVWIAQQYATRTGFAIWIGKIGGFAHGDWNAEEVTFDSSTVSPGNQLGVTVRLRNQGDAYVTGTSATVFVTALVFPSSSRAIGTFSIPGTASGDQVEATKSFVVPADLPPGRYRLGVTVDPTPGEYDPAASLAQAADDLEVTGPSTTTTPPNQRVSEGTARVSDGSPSAGESIEVSGSGYAPGSAVDALLFSDPQQLGQAKADSGGNVDFEVTIPSGTSPGSHRLELVGASPDGGTRRNVAVLTVEPTGPAGSHSRLALTGASIGLIAMALLMIDIGGLMIVRARRST